MGAFEKRTSLVGKTYRGVQSRKLIEGATLDSAMVFVPSPAFNRSGL
jgi:hypothetical protein